MSQPIRSDAPFYPMFIYIYNADGTYGDPVQINSREQLFGPGTKLMIRVAMQQKREIRITDPDDMCLFHAANGKVIFDGEKIHA